MIGPLNLKSFQCRKVFSQNGDLVKYFMAAYFCPLHARYVNMRLIYVNMQDNYVDMQYKFSHMLI